MLQSPPLGSRGQIQSSCLLSCSKNQLLPCRHLATHYVHRIHTQKSHLGCHVYISCVIVCVIFSFCHCVSFYSELTLDVMPRHVRRISGDKVQEILRNALPLLCSNAISYGSQISIDALIGITVDSSEVILVNIHEALDRSGNRLPSDKSAGGYDGQHAVKLESADDVGCTSFHQEQENFTATAADSSEYTDSMYTSAETSGFGSSGQTQPSADVVDVTHYGDGDDELGYNENFDLEEDKYVNSFQADQTDKFGGEYFDTGITYGAGDDATGGGMYAGDVKPFSMPTVQPAGYSLQVHRSVTISGPRGHKRRGAAQTSVGRQSQYKFGTPRRQPKAAAKKEFANYGETGGLSPNVPHSKGILANEKTTVYTCSLCGKMFSHAATLQRHKQQHEGVVYRCDLCGAVLCRRDVLHAHRRKCEEKMMQRSSTEPFDTM